jgi:hypothetical protein
MIEIAIFLGISGVIAFSIFVSVLLIRRRLAVINNRSAVINKRNEQQESERLQEQFEMHWQTHQGCSGGEPGVVD